MKICVISSSALPSPPPDGQYGGLEAVAGFFAVEAARLGHDVTLVSSLGSGLRNMPDLKLSNLTVMETINPSWEPDSEYRHFLEYREYVAKNFGGGDSIVWDNTWAGYPYLMKIADGSPDMRIIHTHHGMLGFPNPPPVPYPMWMGVSRAHAALMASTLKVPVRHIHNGIYMPTTEKQAKARNDGFMLSLNRISPEKGTHHCIDIAMQTRTRLVVAGDDTKVSDQRYVANIIRRCRDSNGLVEYYGLVDAGTKDDLLQRCSAAIACPELNWLEAFGLFAVEAMAYGKPVLAIANGGLAEIIENGKSGFLASTPQALIAAVPRIHEIDPAQCVERAKFFSVNRMTETYLELFRRVLEEGDKW